ncbi:MAG: hypothetical protein JWP01_67 [Myxococcales bacterium]|nr:hypothetical protein [Myxococcales bacterium]
MFRKDRRHAWITFPAALALLAALVSAWDAWLWYLLLVPPLCALPFIADAAARGTHRAVQRGMLVTHRLAGLTVLFGLVGTDSPAALPTVALGALMSVVTWRTDSEQRLGVLTILTGVLALAGSFLLIWLRVEPRALFPAAGGLIAGGAWWVIEARRFPLAAPQHSVDADFPCAEIRARRMSGVGIAHVRSCVSHRVRRAAEQATVGA